MNDTFWQRHQLRLDPWGEDYEAPVALGHPGGETDACVDLDAEGVPWGPVRPPDDLPLPGKLLMIDGRRRLDARLLGRADDGPLYGAFATVAVGAVAIDRQARRATCLPPIIKRILAFGGDVRVPATAIPCPLGSGQTLVYAGCESREENEPQTPLTIVQQIMLQEEAALASGYEGQGETQVLRDGPLLYSANKPESILGYVKTMQKAYLPAPQARLLWELPAGHRTPLFTIGGPGGSDMRWSWYLRSGADLDAPEQAGLHGLSGLVRLELSARVELARARAIADQSALLIPHYASRPYRDPRAPQNLTPIGALERELGRHMGDAALIKRRLRRFLASAGDPTIEKGASS